MASCTTENTKPERQDRTAPLMTVPELAALLRRTKGAVYQMIARAQIPAECIVRAGGRVIRFDPAAVDLWIQASKGSR